MSIELRCSDPDQTKRDIPSFIEPRPPLISNPFMRPRPQKGQNLMELFDDSESEEADWVQVYLRLKPCNVRNNLYEVKNERCLITSVDTTTAGHGRRTQHNISKMYTFSHIFRAESTQKEIFEKVVKDNLKKLPEGHNFTLLTYGASGSGKTYTLMGTVTAPGLVPRSLEYVFRVVDAAQHPAYKPSDGGAEKLGCHEQEYELQFVKKLRQLSAPTRDKYRRMSAQLRNDMTSNWDLSNRTRYYVWVSFIEIYNEAIYDLLTNCDRSKATSKLRIREDANGNVYVKGATQAFVRSGEEAYDVMVAGKHNLQVAATGVHANSSRSHCIFTITMLTETDSGVRTSCVRLCDLAGSERARQTRNTGARMQESRAINSSLHVLERCLHMLRRKQRHGIDTTLVPYRESKLTRLLGAGLSGSRGEAVSMVVTLNPAPEYAHETRHVLQLAAVARDIQVNQTTIAESVLESTVDTNSTIESSAELMRLRTENERLHYELAQAETRNKELLAAMEEKRQEVAKTMFEFVEEAKDMTRQYYEAQIKSLRAQMEEMQEEYEQRLEALENPECQCSSATPSLTQQIEDLKLQIAILEEKLTAEKLARARAEEEVQHLRACIDERDEKFQEEPIVENEELLSESESEDDDPANESMEPSFKKEDLNRSRLLQRSILDDTTNSESKIDSDHDHTLNSENNESIVEKSGGTLKDVDESQAELTIAEDNTSDDTFDSAMTKVNETLEKSASVRGTYFVNDVDGQTESKTKVRGTYCVQNSIMNSTEHYSSIKENDDDSKNITVDSDKSNTSVEMPQTVKKNKESVSDVSLAHFEMDSDTKSASSRITRANDISLAQFEQLEENCKLAENCREKSIVKDTNELFSNIKASKAVRHFFDDDADKNQSKLNKDKNYFENIEINITKVEEKKILLDDRSPSIVKEEIDNYEPSTMKKLLGESFTRSDLINSVHKNVVVPKKQASVDIFDGFDSPNILKTETTTKTCLPKSTEKRKFFESIPNVDIKTEVDLNGSKENDTNVLKTDTKKDEDIFVKPKEVKSNTEKVITTRQELSILDVCVPKVNTDIEVTRKSIEQLVLDKMENKSKNSTILNETELLKDNTMDEFENIYKNLTLPRATEFDLLISQNSTMLNETNSNNYNENEKRKYNLRQKNNTSIEKKDKAEKSMDNNDKSIEKKNKSSDKETDVILIESKACESKAKLPKRNLRLRRRRNQEDDEEGKTIDLENEKVIDLVKKEKIVDLVKKENIVDLVKDKSDTMVDQADKKPIDYNPKLKDIINLQKEFSDVTMDVPAPKKETKDIPSPEKKDDENLPPLGIQSCPSKSVTRSRRKLFTPRPEVLEESLPGDGESNERVRVPRPSYHRARARRKL